MVAQLSGLKQTQHLAECVLHTGGLVKPLGVRMITSTLLHRTEADVSHTLHLYFNIFRDLYYTGNHFETPVCIAQTSSSEDCSARLTIGDVNLSGRQFWEAIELFAIVLSMKGYV